MANEYELLAMISVAHKDAAEQMKENGAMLESFSVIKTAFVMAAGASLMAQLERCLEEGEAPNREEIKEIFDHMREGIAECERAFEMIGDAESLHGGESSAKH